MDGQRAARALTASAGALIDELVRSGVRHFCLCPGSRSAPLALSIAEHPAAQLWVHLDERSAAFFGLGLAKAGGEPVALVCSSGTAAANFLPAVVEARLSRVPLVVLTADRPHELRDNGAPQTIDQLRLYGSHVKWFFDLAEPDLDPEQVRHVRTLACRAAAEARAWPAGPVHLNCPYREPLVPRPLAPTEAAAFDGRPDGQPYLRVSAGPRRPAPDLVASLAASLAASPHGLIVCGPGAESGLAQPLAALAAALGYPILADPLSGLRRGRHDLSFVLDCYDAVLRDSGFVEQARPQVVLRFGAMPTSKPVLLYLQRHADCRLVVVDAGGGWNEPTSLAGEMVHADGRLLCEALLAALPARGIHPDSWAVDWQAADRAARAAISSHLAEQAELFEGKVFTELADLLPDGATLFAGNSMPVRDLDTFFPRGERRVVLMANRGANGIDGVVSSALGAGAAGGGPLVLVIGDLSFYHDSNGLLAARRHGLDALIVLLNNDGGGIFSFLPQASQVPAERFELLFGTPHGLDFRPLAETYGARLRRVASWDEFRSAVHQGLAEGGLQVVEVPTERARNVALHRELWPLVSAAIQQPAELAERV